MSLGISWLVVFLHPSILCSTGSWLWEIFSQATVRIGIGKNQDINATQTQTQVSFVPSAFL